ncbi:MAG: hypothetical protein WDA12_05235 [Bacilli bacterium]
MKSIKKKNKKNNKIVVNSNDEVTKLVQITMIIIVIFVAFYAITSLLTTKNEDDLKEPTKATIQYVEILASNMLMQKENEYYVLVMFEKDLYKELYESYFEQYRAIPGSLSKYDVNIANVFNKGYIGEISNFKGSELKFKDTTLVKIKDQKIVDTHEGREEIIKQLKVMIQYKN